MSQCQVHLVQTHEANMCSTYKYQALFVQILVIEGKKGNTLLKSKVVVTFYLQITHICTSFSHYLCPWVIPKKLASIVYLVANFFFFNDSLIWKNCHAARARTRSSTPITCFFMEDDFGENTLVPNH